MIAAVDREVNKVIIDMIDVSDEFLLVVDKLVGVSIGQLGAGNPVQRQILLANGVDLFNAGPEVPCKTLIACGQQIDVIEHTVMTIILNVFEA